MEKYYVSEYWITQETMIIKANKDRKYRSVIIELGKEIYCTMKPIQILQLNCIVSGSSFQGKVTAIKSTLGSNKKIPIPINTDKNIYMMPTSAIKNENCVWINYAQIKSFVDSENKTLLTFYNGYQLRIDASRKSFTKLYSRTAIIIVQFNREHLFNKQTHHCPLIPPRLDV